MINFIYYTLLIGIVTATVYAMVETKQSRSIFWTAGAFIVSCVGFMLFQYPVLT